ncbi:phage tail protein [Vibrio sp. V39_P1S14PM300]|uniref:phage tail protein n=1 Tax=Vibrio sp. V39_P1S14PM300 TaxID=1938690 RepID=UPI00137280D7|nr:phage tail protein [Vibrio sp. V39_P1S14PM300]NAX21014.1 phage tail protein [Vibrio sp. V39_P1S14PM300]
MSTAQNLKTVVTLGGAVDASFGNMAGTVDRELGKATKQVKSLEREQGKLTKQIKKAKMAGADVSLLTKRYQALDREIDDARRSAEGFGAASDIGGTLKSVTGHAVATTGAVTGLTMAVTGLMSVTNAQTAEQVGLAKAYGMSIEQFKAWGGVAQQAGLNAESTGDMVEELTNKFGEFKALGKQSSVADVFGKLGIDKAMLDGLSAAEQFEFVMRRLERVSDKQQAASLADMLFGGEGNKVVTYIRNSGKSLDDLLDAQKRINSLTTQGADGAFRYNNAWNNVLTAVTSSWQEVAGVVGGALEPQLSELSQTVSRVFSENKAGIVDFVTGVVDSSIRLTTTLYELGSSVNDVVQFFGGWESAGALVAGMLAGKMVIGIASVVTGITTMITTLKTAKTVMIGLNAVMAANPIGAVAAAVGLLTTAGILLYQNWDEVTAWFAGKLEWFKTAFPETFETIKSLFDWSPIEMIAGHWEAVPSFFTSMWGKVTAIFDQSVGAVMETWEKVSGFVDDLKFWDDEEESASSPRQVEPYGYSQRRSASSSGYTGGYGYAARANAVLSDTESASKGQTTIQNNNTVEKIEVVTQPGQSNEEIGRSVADKLSDNSGAMYDYSYSE